MNTRSRKKNYLLLKDPIEIFPRKTCLKYTSSNLLNLSLILNKNSIEEGPRSLFFPQKFQFFIKIFTQKTFEILDEIYHCGSYFPDNKFLYFTYHSNKVVKYRNTIFVDEKLRIIEKFFCDIVDCRKMLNKNRIDKRIFRKKLKEKIIKNGQNEKYRKLKKKIVEKLIFSKIKNIEKTKEPFFLLFFFSFLFKKIRGNLLNLFLFRSSCIKKNVQNLINIHGFSCGMFSLVSNSIKKLMLLLDPKICFIISNNHI